MSFALDVVTIAGVSAGAFFFLAGTVGLLRFPDTPAILILAFDGFCWGAAPW